MCVCVKENINTSYAWKSYSLSIWIFCIKIIVFYFFFTLIKKKKEGKTEYALMRNTKICVCVVCVSFFSPCASHFLGETVVLKLNTHSICKSKVFKVDMYLKVKIEFSSYNIIRKNCCITKNFLVR